MADIPILGRVLNANAATVDGQDFAIELWIARDRGHAMLVQSGQAEPERVRVLATPEVLEVLLAKLRQTQETGASLRDQARSKPN